MGILRCGHCAYVGMLHPQPRAAAWNVAEIPRDFSFGEISPDWERMTPYLEEAMSRVPRTLDVLFPPPPPTPCQRPLGAHAYAGQRANAINGDAPSATATPHNGGYC